METLDTIAGRIARRDPARAEAMLQADIRSFILTAGLNVTDAQMADVNDVGMEAQVGTGTRWRIDIETGTTVIEVKRDLSKGSTLADGEAQIGRYLQLRSRQTGARYLGVLTDGHQWRLYVPDPDGVGALSSGEPLIVSSAADTETLRYWLGTVLATVDQIKPSGEAIVRALGAKSPAHAADHATLRALYRVGASRPEIRLKRELWAKLLRTAFGSTFDDDEDLFVDHTLLVMTAEIIAHAVTGFDISLTGGLTATELVSGSRFRESEISGVVEDDFFDWPVDIAGGAQFVRSLASRLSRFDWSRPDHDALKHLYEAVISQQTREALGEYYTPYRMAAPLTAVVPVSISDPSRLADLAEIDMDPGLSKWWGQVEATWRAHRIKTEKKPLVERVDYSSQLTAQLPLDHSKRVVYSASGNTLTAARIDNPEPLIEHKLYWAPVRSDDEGRYLVGILNSATLLKRVQPLQARGLFGPRDFDKHVFQVPFDTYDPNDPDHLDLVVAVKNAEQLAARVDVSAAGTFQKARKLIRIALDRAGIAERVEESVNRVLPEVQ